MATKEKQIKTIHQMIKYYESELKIAEGHKDQCPKGYLSEVRAKINHFKNELNKLKKE